MTDTKQISFTEFLMWLQGVEDMQEEGWVPNPTQWKRIRAKLNTVDDTSPVQELQPYPQQYQYPPQQYVPQPGYGGLADPNLIVDSTVPQIPSDGFVPGTMTGGTPGAFVPGH